MEIKFNAQLIVRSISFFWRLNYNSVVSNKRAANETMLALLS